MRRLIAIVLLLTLATQLQAQTLQEAEKKIRWSLVYLEATAETENGAPLRSTATGFIVTAQGRVLTAHHLIEELERAADALNQGRINRSTIQIRAHVGYKEATPMTAELVNWIPVRDLLVLDLASRPEGYSALCVKTNLDPQSQQDVATAGFPDTAPYVGPYPGRFISPDGPNGTWLTNLVFNPGQSGSPVFTPSGAVVGIAKGQMRGSDNQPVPGQYVVVPIDDAFSLVANLKPCAHEREYNRAELGKALARIEAELDKAKQQKEDAEARLAETMVEVRELASGARALHIQELLVEKESAEERVKAVETNIRMLESTKRELRAAVQSSVGAE